MPTTKILKALDYTYVHLNKYLRKARKKSLEANKKIIFDYVTSSQFQYGLNTEPREIKIIVSLTTFPARFDMIELCLKSLVLQTIKPDKIMVYLDNNCIQSEIDLKLGKYMQYGIEFILKQEDLKPHKKYFYAMQDFPNDIVITVDDDAIYPPDLIESLLLANKKYPDCICARRVHKITRKFNGELHSYNNWINNYTISKKPSFKLIATGIGGVLYPPNCLDKRAFDKQSIMQTSLRQDDLWLKFMEVLNGTKTVWASNKCPEPYTIENSQTVCLSHENVANFQNDNAINLLTSKFKIEIDGKKIIKELK